MHVSTSSVSSLMSVNLCGCCGCSSRLYKNNDRPGRAADGREVQAVCWSGWQLWVRHWRERSDVQWPARLLGHGLLPGLFWCINILDIFNILTVKCPCSICIILDICVLCVIVWSETDAFIHILKKCKTTFCFITMCKAPELIKGGWREWNPNAHLMHYCYVRPPSWSSRLKCDLLQCVSCASTSTHPVHTVSKQLW